jgi:hypothetical protein
MRLKTALLFFALFCLPAEGKIFGFTLKFSQSERSNNVAFSTINEVTGEQVTDKFGEVPYEAVSGGLSAMDAAHGIAYVIGYNLTDHKPNLVGIDTKSGKVAVDLELPFGEAGLVGIGQALDVDPTTGDVIAIGQASNAAGTLKHHYVIRIDFKTKAVMTVANISKDVPSIGVLNGMGGGNTLDYTRNVEYINLAVNKSGGADVATIRIDLKTGTSTIAGNSTQDSMMNGLHFDAKSDRIYGFGKSIAPPPNGTKPIHTLAYLNAADGASAPFKVIGGIPGYFLLEAAVVTVDPVARRFYTLLQPVQANPGWAPSTDCAKGPFPCATGTTCCEDPASKAKAGACYKVTDCSHIHNGGGINTTLPFQLVGIDLETAAVTTHPDLCTIGKNDCPSDLDAATALGW